jgi:hypothetical protein
MTRNVSAASPRPPLEVLVFVCPTCGTETPEGTCFVRDCCIQAVTTPELHVDIARFHDDGGAAHSEED